MMSNNPVHFKKRILLLQPPLEDFYTTPIRLYPLGLLYVAAVLEACGHTVFVLDSLNPIKKKTIRLPDYFSYLKEYLQFPYFFKGYYRFGLSNQEILAKIKDFAPDLIGISSECTAYYKNVAEIAGLIKQQTDCPIIIGGHHATFFAEEIRQRTPFIDLVYRGPAEHGLLRDLNAKGILSAPAAGDIDWQTVRPAHHLLDAEHYRMSNKRYASLTASRGCPYRCEFCSVHSMFGREFSCRPVDAILQEMRRLNQFHHVRIFNFEDDNLTYNRPWFLQLMHAIGRDAVLQNIELTAMNGICHTTLDEEMLRVMKKAGFRELNLSLVTQSQLLRDRYHRPTGFLNLEDIIRIARRLDFFITVYVIIGLPGQRYQEVKDSIDALLSLGVLVGPSVFYIPAGSALYDKLPLSSEMRENWNLYRSSAFAVDSEQLSRRQLVELFVYARRENIKRKQ